MPEDQRKHNGGHSTTAKGVDGRKNKYKSIVAETISPNDVAKVLRMLLVKSVQGKDTKAAQLLLDYTLGKPKESLRVDVGEGLELHLKDLIKFGD
tara:strand:+ start:885 stop:1169 length:285 start_codon:yes stop_codon:yes gene_type:complete